MIADNYRNIKTHFAGGRISPLGFRWACILLDQDTENPPFEPCRFFVVNVFAETKDQVIDCLGEEYPWCDIMHIDKAQGGVTDDELLAGWLAHHDEKEAVPLREAPHGKEYKDKTFVVRERADVIFEYIVEAMDTQEAADKVMHGQCTSHNTQWIEHEIIEAVETTYDNSK